MMRVRSSHPSDEFIRSATLIKVVDGDTIRVDIDLGWSINKVEDVRLFGVNTPETRGKERPAGLWVKDKVIEWFEHEDANIVLQSNEFKVGKFGRCICHLWCDNRCLNNWLLDCKLGWPTNKEGSVLVSRDLNVLNLPQYILNNL